MLPTLQTAHIAVIGLGYVGLPLAAEFGKKYRTVGFDINAKRIGELKQGMDRTHEMSSEELAEATLLQYTSDPADIADCNIYIVTVPTPIDTYKRPDLTPLLKASETIGKVLKPDNIVIYESTVYPGATEEDCVPVLERTSGLTYISTEGLAGAVSSLPPLEGGDTHQTGRGNFFFCGYSPERINPGDKAHRLPDIKKVTSGSTPEVAELVDSLYASIIRAGTFKASSIKVAEAAKVIENTQRDLNIALMNELAIIFHRLGIDTLDVLAAAGTKWNFLPFRPGLVGGHCIGVDPYYLTHKAQAAGYHPEVILAGRRINDGMGAHIAQRLVQLMLRRGIEILGSRVLILGFTFKENCPDVRNTRVIDIVNALQDYGIAVDIHDPLADPDDVLHEYGVVTRQNPPQPDAPKVDAVLLAVAHAAFAQAGEKSIRAWAKPNGVVFDVKGVFPATQIDARI